MLAAFRKILRRVIGFGMSPWFETSGPLGADFSLQKRDEKTRAATEITAFTRHMLSKGRADGGVIVPH